ncbi:RIP metalloprotease RseP [Gynurincola endophyticus]|jgi:regulator of sigma E protease|uniref:RIP metalloprotease RseP n=1 Tax=Gynurincola endophyticus TaxID=2479004 RepID=UPI000F8E5D85|nr:RIP metalloprotease RseP [Gynurincola endophyticus]
MTTLLAIDWSLVGIKAAQLFLSLSILVVLHELGHFLPAKWFKCRVEKFYLFFDPYFSLFKKKIGETVYGIGWLPLGGYVKISGMIDESMDKEQIKQPAQPWEFRSKPAWQRLIIMIGGVTVNLILGFVIFVMISFVWGDTRLDMNKLENGIVVNGISKNAGLQNGDRIISIDQKVINDYFDINRTLILDEAKSIQVNRNGEVVNLEIPKGTIRSLIKSKSSFVTPRIQPIVGTINEDIADFTKDSLIKNDVIVALNGQPVKFQDELLTQLKGYPNQEVALTVLRGTDTVVVGAKTDSSAAIGFFVNIDQLPTEKVDYNLGQSIPAGISKGWETVVMQLKNFKMLFTSDEVKASESLGSFISIGNMFGAEWDWERFWHMTALLSFVLAIMNMLPIPALDGGHVMITLYEIITGRKPSDKFLEYAQIVGMILVLGLMAYAIGLDLWRYIFGGGN